jgi:Zn-dependent protease
MEAFILIAVLIGSIVVHEVAHAWQARREGDDTAEKLGRITLNPIPHLDPFGSFIVPALLYLSGSGIFFGWAKPVPVNPMNYRDYVAGDIRVSLAGIVSNLILAVVSTVLMAVLVKVQSVAGVSSAVFEPVFIALEYGIMINLVLAFFNLVPIPPLDGSHVVAHLLPKEAAARYRQFGQYGILALMGILYFLPGALGAVLYPVYFLRGLADWFIRLWI